MHNTTLGDAMQERLAAYMDSKRILAIVNTHSYPDMSTPNPPPREALEADPELHFTLPGNYRGRCVCHQCIFNVCSIVNHFYRRSMTEVTFKQRVRLVGWLAGWPAGAVHLLPEDPLLAAPVPASSTLALPSHLPDLPRPNLRPSLT